MVSESDIVISAITESARRRGRGLLAAGVDVAFTVENAADATVAQRIATNITTASALTTLAAETGATATVVEVNLIHVVDSSLCTINLRPKALTPKVWTLNHQS